MDPRIDQIRIALEPGGILVLQAILALLMLGVALEIRMADLARVARAPRGPLIGLGAQFLVLPAATFVLTLVIEPLPSVALGMLLVASCPGGNVSNFLTYLAGGNVALSVSMTSISSLAAMVMTPVNLALWGGLNPATAPLLTSVRIDPVEVLLTVTLVLAVPLAIGMALGHRHPAWSARVRRPLRAVGSLAFLAFIGVGLARNAAYLIDGMLLPVVAIVAVHNATALGLGYAMARAGGLPDGDARAVSIEVGIQNSGLGLAIAIAFFGGLGGMVAVACLWGVWHLVAGLSLATYWGSHGALTAPESA